MQTRRGQESLRGKNNIFFGYPITWASVDDDGSVAGLVHKCSDNCLLTALQVGQTPHILLKNAFRFSMHRWMIRVFKRLAANL